jgi:Domain of unknown function (DUF4157)
MKLAPFQRPKHRARSDRYCQPAGNPLRPSGTSPALSHPLIQAKLRIGAPNDKYEQEADRVADHVMRMPESLVKARADSHPARTQNTSVQRKCQECHGGSTPCPDCKKEELHASPEELREPTVQAKAEPKTAPALNDPAKAASAPNPTMSTERLANPPGHHLDTATRAFMEPRFGCDFRPVRIHTDTSARRVASSIGAQAFTHRNDIYFAAGKYMPQTNAGRHLLAHELTHTIQQGHATAHKIHHGTQPCIQRSGGQGGIGQLDEMLNRLNVPEEEVISLLGSLTPSEKQTVLRNNTYKGMLVSSLGNAEMARAVDALGAELADKLDWMATEGTDYDLIKPRIQTASSSEQLAVLRNQTVLASLRDGLWFWDDFAKCVELLGRWAPSVSTLIMDAQVQDVLETAWVKSNPGVRTIPVQQYIHEEGGWIFLNLITDDLVFRTKSGGPSSTALRVTPSVDDSIVVAIFHTHPQLGEDFKRPPSPEDIAFGDDIGVPGIIRTEVDRKREYFFFGPQVRRHLAGGKPRSWSYPGPSGGVAP